MDGYRTALPLTLAATELMALVVSRDMLKPPEGTEIQVSLDSALTKAAAALSAEGIKLLEQPQSHFSVGLGSHKTYRPSQKTGVGKDGRLAMSLRAADTRELVGWVLHFGSGVQVISPASFRDKVREEARKILAQV